MVHDTYAEHCAARVEGTPAHGGGPCLKCDVRALLAEHPADLPVAIDSTTAAEVGSRD